MATNPNSRTEIRELPKLSDNDVVEIEKEIDRLTEKLPELNSFILPGGHPLVSLTHVCRTVCRRTERSIVSVINRETGSIPLRFIDDGDLVLRYFNRLSDYFFTLSRAIAIEKGITETKWTTK